MKSRHRYSRPQYLIPLVFIVFGLLFLSRPRVDDGPRRLATMPVADDPVQTSLRTRSDRERFHDSFCQGHSRIDEETGAWCLKDWPVPRWFGKRTKHRLAKHHFPADEGVGYELLALFGNTDVLDLGAGVGQYGVYFQDERRRGSYVAFDGAFNVDVYTEGFVHHADLTKPLRYSADWVLSLEVGEHIPQKHESQYLDNVANNARVGVVLSWAWPGQPGHGHVNTKTGKEVMALMAERGFDYDEEWTLRLRWAVKTLKYLKGTLLVFRRAPSL